MAVFCKARGYLIKWIFDLVPKNVVNKFRQLWDRNMNQRLEYHATKLRFVKISNVSNTLTLCKTFCEWQKANPRRSWNISD